MSRFVYVLLLFLSVILPVGCQNVSKPKENKIEMEESVSQNTDEMKKEALKKGYALPIDEDKKEEAESDCKEKMLLVQAIYIAADKGKTANVVIEEGTVGEMILTLRKTGSPVMTDSFHYNMANYENMEMFLRAAMNGNSGEIVTYHVHSDGTISRIQFIFDGSDMYVLRTTALWNDEDQPGISDTSYTRLRKWEYTEKGYLSISYCVPEPPEVSEVVNGNALIRVKPREEKNIEITEKYLRPLGYQGNNLLCSDWDAEHLENIDYNGLFEYLYAIEYGEQIDREKYADGILKEEFEDLIMRYLPVMAEQIRQMAEYDEMRGVYAWNRQGCLNYAPNEFGTSYPEVTEVQENEDGSITLTVDAVCEMSGNDAVITHQLTVRFYENGQIQYLSNSILDDGLNRIPAYQYRI